MFLTELLPNESAFRQGLEEGADAAFEARSLKEIGEGTEGEVPAVTPKRPAKSASTVRAKKAGAKKA